MEGRLLVDGEAIEEELVVASTDAMQVSFEPLDPPTTTPPIDNPPVDDAPLPRVAILPAGAYATGLTLWPEGAAITPGLDRDFVRVAVVDEERHLVGIERRDSREPTDDPDERRGSHQNRPSTRIPVARTASNAPVLLATADDAAIALDLVLTAPGPTRAVLGVADVEAGPAGPGLLPTDGAPFPIDLREFRRPRRGHLSRACARRRRPRRRQSGGAARGRSRRGARRSSGCVPGRSASCSKSGFARASPAAAAASSAGRGALVLTLPAGRVDGQGLLRSICN